MVGKEVLLISNNQKKYPLRVYNGGRLVKVEERKRTDSSFLNMIFDVLDWVTENPDLVIAIGVGVVTAGIYLRSRSLTSIDGE